MQNNCGIMIILSMITSLANAAILLEYACALAITRKKMYPETGNNDCKIYVGNLPDDVRVRDIEDLFYKYGKIVDIDLHDRPRKGPPFSFVEFEDER